MAPTSPRLTAKLPKCARFFGMHAKVMFGNHLRVSGGGAAVSSGVCHLPGNRFTSHGHVGGQKSSAARKNVDGDFADVAARLGV